VGFLLLVVYSLPFSYSLRRLLDDAAC
jgi:hypothetical protein